MQTISHILFCLQKMDILICIVHIIVPVSENPHVIDESKRRERFSINVSTNVLGDNVLGAVKLSNLLNGEINQDKTHRIY